MEKFHKHAPKQTGIALPLPIIALILCTTLGTSFLSGIFGMAGGLILMGVLIAVMPVSQAMIVHGVIQMFANGWRAFLLRDHIKWTLIVRYSAGASTAFVGLLFVSWTPDKHLLYLFLGLIPMIIWLPRQFFHLDISRRNDALLAGLVVSGLNTIAGVAGPVLDIFFVQSEMTRKEIVANKSFTQLIAHLVKIVVWTGPAIAAAEQTPPPPLWLFITAIPITMLGTWLGGRVLHHMNDVNFKRYMKWLVTAIGVVFLGRAVALW